MEINEFSERLSSLRVKKGVSARDMSLSLGQSAGYINNIENRVSYPSMTLFFYICEYLEITPQEFFDVQNKNPKLAGKITSDITNLTDRQLEAINVIIDELKK